MDVEGAHVAQGLDRLHNELHKLLIDRGRVWIDCQSEDIAEDGSLSGRRVFAELERVTPDGICLDVEGAVWVSSPSTSEFLRVTEGGTVTDRIPVPGKGAIACMLGGDDRRTLFLCTAQATAQDLAQGKSVGWIETVRVEVPGAGRP